MLALRAAMGDRLTTWLRLTLAPELQRFARLFIMALSIAIIAAS